MPLLASSVTEISLSQSLPTTPFSSGVSNADNERFQSEIARGFYAAGLPFRTIEVPRMRRALTVLQPDTDKYLPNRKALAGRLLTQEYDCEKAELIARLHDEPTLGLISDGWTSVNKEKVTNYVVVPPLMRPLLWCTRTSDEDEQTAEYVASEIGDVIDEINEAAGKDAVMSVTTDNAPVMQKAWEILEATRPISATGAVAMHSTSYWRSKDAKANIFYNLGDESEDEDDGEADVDGVDQESEVSSASSASSDCSNRAIEDFSLSYEGIEEQKHED
ncbi:uncharacterized protein IUM83_19719 [Phytophthora cinnamomi]|uniref:uncharacterized protein n=1 Tax=Phytophthora cinnamomi TaxID=4785 RepID=UPI00355A6784|nr:hypothetical protein IUM83_19719 [Phytophthora cinnamomi]